MAWCDFLLAFTALDGQVNLDNLLVNAPDSDTMTVTRIIGDFKVMYSSSDENEGIHTVDCGIGVVNKEAFGLTTGVGVPNPTIEEAAPPRGWLYAHREAVSQTIPSGGTPAAMWRQEAHFKFDLRGQRKVDKGVLFMWLEHNDFTGTTATLTYIGRIRTLFKT